MGRVELRLVVHFLVTILVTPLLAALIYYFSQLGC